MAFSLAVDRVLVVHRRCRAARRTRKTTPGNFFSTHIRHFLALLPLAQPVPVLPSSVVAPALPTLLVSDVCCAVDAALPELAAPRAAVALAPVVPTADKEDALTVMTSQLECGLSSVHLASRMDEKLDPDIAAQHTAGVLHSERSSTPRAQVAT